MKTITPEPGDRIIARMFDGRTVVGQVCIGGVFDSVSGHKVRFQSGAALYLIDSKQVVKTVRRRFNVFLRKPGVSKKLYVSRRVLLGDAEALVRNYNQTHSEKRAELEEARR
jgi:hypothetical protein